MRTFVLSSVCKIKGTYIGDDNARFRSSIICNIIIIGIIIYNRQTPDKGSGYSQL